MIALLLSTDCQKYERNFPSPNLKCFPGLNPLNAKLNPTCYLMVLLGAHPILHVSRIRVNMKKGALVEIGTC